MKIDISNKRDLEMLDNESTDATSTIVLGKELGVYIISEKKGNINLVKPVIINIPWKDFLQSVGMTVGMFCGMTTRTEIEH